MTSLISDSSVEVATTKPPEPSSLPRNMCFFNCLIERRFRAREILSVGADDLDLDDLLYWLSLGSPLPVAFDSSNWRDYVVSLGTRGLGATSVSLGNFSSSSS